MVQRANMRRTTRIVNPLDLPPAKSESDMSPEQKRIADLEHQLAVTAGRKDEVPEEVEVPEEATDNILIHFLVDGFTALGRLWYRGQELEFTPGSEAYKDTCDRDGASWLDMDDKAQMSKYDQIFFRRGPWPGKKYTDASTSDYRSLKVVNGDGKLVAVREEDLARAEELESSRRRAAPRLPSM